MEYFKASLLDEKATERCLVRMSHEILEKNKGTEDLVLIGILRRGKPLAERIAENIAAIEGANVPCGEIDINFYRDDLEPVADSPLVRRCELPFSIVGKTVVLVDDVLYTGRTVRAAIEAIFSLGRPKAIQLAILIDRGHRELPIRADYIGKAVATSKKEHIRVHIPPIDDDLGVSLFENRI